MSGKNGLFEVSRNFFCWVYILDDADFVEHFQYLPLNSWNYIAAYIYHINNSKRRTSWSAVHFLLHKKASNTGNIIKTKTEFLCLFITWEWEVFTNSMFITYSSHEHVWSLWSQHSCIISHSLTGPWLTSPCSGIGQQSLEKNYVNFFHIAMESSQNTQHKDLYTQQVRPGLK